LLDLTTNQWLLLMFGAALMGFSKSGVPGTGILTIPMFVAVFGARLSIGTSIVILILADLFAVRFYWRETKWDHLLKLLPSVIVGFLVGVTLLYFIPKSQRDPLNPLIGVIVLLMLGVSLLRGKLGEKMVPTSQVGRQVTGSLAGFTTLVSNAAGPIMQIYFAAAKLNKAEMLGTSAIYFFCVNTTKIPFYLWLSYVRPDAPMWTVGSCLTAAATLPAITVGTMLGRKAQSKISEQAFKNVVLVLAAVASIKMILGW
jgi:uncharacterized protein